MNANTNKKQVATRFATETRFAVRPVTTAPFRANLENEFERLKARLLAEQLAQTENPALNAPVRRAANEAAALAWVTFHPLLLFPELFAEKVSHAVCQAKRQARVYANSLELLAA